MKNAVYKISLWCFIVIGVVSCQVRGSLELPQAKFNNFQTFNKQKVAFKCTYSGNGKITISDFDTIVLPLDSNLHFELFKHFNWEIEDMYIFYEFVLIEMDAKTPYTDWLVLQNELRKLNLLNVGILTNSHDSFTGIQKRLPPVWEEEELYFYPGYLERGLVLPSPPPFHFSKYDSLPKAYFEIVHDQISVHSETGESIGFREFVKNNENVMCRYQEESLKTFQNYVQITDTIFGTITQIRKERMVLENLTKKQVKKIYPIRMVPLSMKF